MNARMSHPPAHRKERDEPGTARRFKTHDQFFTVVDRATCHDLSAKGNLLVSRRRSRMCILSACGVRPRRHESHGDQGSKPKTESTRTVKETVHACGSVARNSSCVMSSARSGVIYLAHCFGSAVRRTSVLALLVCGIVPQCVAAKLNLFHITGTYLTHNARVLQALTRKTPGTYWIDGRQMTIQKGTQICWHGAPLKFGRVLNNDGQPVPRLKPTSPCETAQRGGALGQGAWLQYVAILKYHRNCFKPLVATCIDIWKSESMRNPPGGQSRVPRERPEPARQALCASASPHELRYPNEGPIDVICDAKVNSYVENVFSAMLKPSASTPDVPIAKQEVPSFYVVRPFRVKHDYDFEAIDGSLAHGDLNYITWYENPHAHSTVREIVYAQDASVLIPDTALARLNNEAQFAALLPYSLAAEDQDIIGRLFRVQRFTVSMWSRKKNGGNNLLYMWEFISNLNRHVLLIGIRQMYLAGYNIRYAPLAWDVEQGKQIKGPVDEPHKNMPWYAVYGFNAISQLYPNVDYSKLKRGEREYAQFLDELRKADPQVFEQSK